MKNTTKNILTWIHDNLGEIHREVIQGTIYTMEMMGGLVCREYGFLIPSKVNAGLSFEEIAEQAVGDSGHGRHFWQIDDRSYPDFVNDTPQSDIIAYAKKAIEVLEEKRRFLDKKGWTQSKLGDELYLRAILASYNCGQGNVHKALKAGKDVDHHTYNGDYSAVVIEYTNIYKELYTPGRATAVNGEDKAVLPPPMKAIQ